ncbi:MAG: FHA domain-containing protein [Myxococcales bacterium]|nr:FHA domain-containing protein [Myxococcales bacterium]
MPARMLIGRASTCALQLDDRKVSGEHATLAWDGSAWTLRDLGSRNGTFVDGERLDAGASRQLDVGQRLSFGGPEGGFLLVDVGAPAALAESAAGLRVAEDGQLALPDAHEPEVVVYADGRGGWVLERAGESQPVQDGAVVDVRGMPWTIRVPAHLEGTATVDAGPTLDTIQLEIAVSMDEEHVELTVVHRGRRTPLEAREHGYILLTLARARLADAELPLAEQGWLDRDRLLKMLGTDTNALNVGIYRARGQLAAAGVDGAASIVEVRRGSRRFGIEPDRFTVTSL